MLVSKRNQWFYLVFDLPFFEWLRGIFMMTQPSGSSRASSSSFGVGEHKHHQIVFYSWSFWLPVLIRTTLLVICSFWWRFYWAIRVVQVDWCHSGVCICRSSNNWICRSLNYWICRSLNDWICRSLNDWICRSSNNWIGRSSNDWICRSLNDWISLSLNGLICQSFVLGTI